MLYPRLRLLSASVTGFALLITTGWFLFAGTFEAGPRYWTIQVPILLMMYAVLACLILWLSAASAKFACLFFQLGAVFILTQPESLGSPVELLLLCGSLVPIAVTTRAPYGAVISTACLVCYDLLFRSQVLEAALLADPRALALVSYRGLLIVLLCFGAAIRYLSDYLGTQQSRLSSLQRSVTQLTAANIGFQDYVAAAERESAEEERKRLSRDIHDVIGHTFVTILNLVQAGIGRGDRVSGDAQPVLHKILEQAQEGLEGARSAARQLRHRRPRRLSIVHALRHLGENFEAATGITIQVDLLGFPTTLGAQMDEVLYHLVQEGFTNSVRHGHATAVEVHGWATMDEIILTVRDNGRGAEAVVKGIGISGMEERIAKLGGALTADSTGAGFVISARLPRPCSRPDANALQNAGKDEGAQADEGYTGSNS